MVLDVGDDVAGEAERPDVAALDGALADPGLDGARADPHQLRAAGVDGDDLHRTSLAA